MSEFTLNVSREAAFHRPVLHLYICSFFFVEGKPLTLIHTVNAAKPSFPTSIVGIVFTCFGWIGQGSPKQEGFKACKFYKFMVNYIVYLISERAVWPLRWDYNYRCNSDHIASLTIFVTKGAKPVYHTRGTQFVLLPVFSNWSYLSTYGRQFTLPYKNNHKICTLLFVFHLPVVNFCGFECHFTSIFRTQQMFAISNFPFLVPWTRLRVQKILIFFSFNSKVYFLTSMPK